MDFRLTAEQKMVRDSVRAWLAQQLSPVEKDGRVLVDSAAVANVLWKSALKEGWIGAFFPERHGGHELDLVAVALAFEEIGRALAPGPFLANMLLLPMLLRRHESAAADLAIAVLGGRRVLGLSQGGVQSGKRDLAVEFHALVSDAISILAKSAGTKAELAVTSVHGLTFEALESFDIYNSLGGVTLSGDPINRRYEIETGDLLPFKVGVSAEIVGIAQRTLEQTLEYVRERHQFGKSVGSFQAVKHRLADCYMQVENARIAVYFAALCFHDRPQDAANSTDLAMAYCAKAGAKVIEACIQMHGGFGFTWESGLHVALRRVQHLSTIFGLGRDARQTLERALVNGSASIGLA